MAKKQTINPYKRIKIDRELNDNDIYVINIKNRKRFVGTKKSLYEAFNRDNIDYICTVKIAFIDKSTTNVKYY